MLKAVVPFAAGILAADRFALPLWFLAGTFLLSGVSALLLRSPLCTLAMLFTAGFGAAQLRDTGRTVPYGVYTAYELSVEGIPADRGRYASAEATVTAWRDPADGTWHPAGDRVTLHADSLTALHPGERLRCRGTVQAAARRGELPPPDDAAGIRGTIWLSERTILERLPARNTAPASACRRTNGPSENPRRRGCRLPRHDGGRPERHHARTARGLFAQRTVAPAGRIGTAHGHRLRTGQSAVVVAAAAAQGAICCATCWRRPASGFTSPRRDFRPAP